MVLIFLAVGAGGSAQQNFLGKQGGLPGRMAVNKEKLKGEGGQEFFVAGDEGTVRSIDFCLCVRASARPAVRPSVCASAHPSARPSVRPLVRPSDDPSVRPSVRLLAHPSARFLFSRIPNIDEC